jgi:hypothetical protein
MTDLGDVLDFSSDKPVLKPAHQIPALARRALASVKFHKGEVVEIKHWDKLAALDKLGEHLGLWGKHEGPGAEVNVNITVEDVIEAKRRVAECRRALGAPPLITSTLDEQVQGKPP